MLKTEVISQALKAAAGAIQFEDLPRYLPFQTRIVSGTNLNHIQSLHVYDITTYGKPQYSYIEQKTLYPQYTVEEGDTLCRRFGRLISTKGGVNDENCQGCHAIAAGLIKRDIENA